ncbi:hypothetical protein RhiJN_05146 [Ceratobasidium sp. AG-Ba]|nr:hypothetical protein RhiJN_05146 [Ceratobasidium sp. AG-Ba]QRW06071.1 hypothetical protein RhiLY_05070 [Ceratobasidium sp. AG-Ba]
MERPPIELEWFVALPKRVRRSAQLIEAAKTDSRVLLKHVRSKWSKTRRIELEREERLRKAQAQPRNLEALRAPEPTAWHGLGRRKKRSRAFESIGRTYNTRWQISGSEPVVSTQPDNMFLLHPSSCHVPKRAPTPVGLHESIRNVPGLIYISNGPANAADYGLPTPCSPHLPSPEPCIPPPAFPYDPQPGEFCVQGQEVNPDLAYIVAYGRHSRAPQVGYSALQAAVDICQVEQHFPDAMGYLERLLFPGGASKYSQMVDSLGMDPWLDFVFGWYEISRQARERVK